MKVKKGNMMNGDYTIFEPDMVWMQECCDCGLNHLWVFREVDKKLYGYVYRDDDETNRIRKKDRIVVYRRKKKE